MPMCVCPTFHEYMLNLFSTDHSSATMLPQNSSLHFLLIFCPLIFAFPGHGQTNSQTSGMDASLRTLTIFHTNDLRGRLMPGTYYDEANRGGMARIVHLLRDLDAANVLILDSGDAMGPELLSQFGEGRLMVDLMNVAKYSAMTVGNHEFAYGLEILGNRAAQADFPLLAANIIHKETNQLLLQSHILVDKAGLRILVVGLVSPRIQKLINPIKMAGIAINDPATTLQEILQQTHEDRADLTIALVHMTASEVEALASAFPAVALFVAGGFDPSEQKDGNLHLMQTAAGNRVVSTPNNGAYVGRIDIRPGDATAFAATLIQVGDNLPPDANAKERIEQHQITFQQSRNQPLGTIPTAIEDQHVFVARLMRQDRKSVV